MDPGLNDRVAIITGSARGIGAETARMLAKEGASVAVTDLDADAAGATARPGHTADIGGAVCFMVSEHARYLTGTTLFVTGGRYG